MFFIALCIGCFIGFGFAYMCIGTFVAKSNDKGNSKGDFQDYTNCRRIFPNQRSNFEPPPAILPWS